MFTLTQVGRTTQQVVCVFLSVLIVAGSLSLGAYGAHTAAKSGYSVTITQL
jgi:hypothetical protein